MQGKIELAQALDHLNYVQYMISDRCSFIHSCIENGTRYYIPFNVIWCPKGLLQLSKDLFGLSFLKLPTKLIVHGSQHYAVHHGSIIDPLLISVSDYSVPIRGWLFWCWIRYHIKGPLML